MKKGLLSQLRHFFFNPTREKTIYFLYINLRKKVTQLTQAIFYEIFEERREWDGLCKNHVEVP